VGCSANRPNNAPVKAGGNGATDGFDPGGGFDPTGGADVTAPPADDAATTADVAIPSGDTNSGTDTATTGDVGPGPAVDAGPEPVIDVPSDCVPVPEYCDGKDNDCDGTADDGVLSPCGDCNPFCDRATFGGPGSPLAAAAVLSDNVLPTGAGGLTSSMESIALQVIWVSNSAEGTVSKLDTETGRELGRYRVCLDPSRTAVGPTGDGWIACRSDGALVAYIWNYDGDCADKNGSGTIETSRDLDGDGRITGGELLPQGTDECVRWTTSTAAPGELARAMGVDSEGYGWVGLWTAGRLLRLDPATGAEVSSWTLAGNPYGLAIADDGRIWTANRPQGQIEGHLPGSGTSDLRACPAAGCQPYGIALDEFGRVWVANLGGGPMTVEIYSPTTQQWSSIPVGNRPRGLVANKLGRVYVALDELSVVQVIDTGTLAPVASIGLGDGRFPLGMAVDAQGDVWAVNQQASSVTEIDAETNAIIAEHPVGAGPYTYSDMTGSAFFNAVKPGRAVFRFEGLAKTGLSGLNAVENTTWTRVELRLETPGTSVITLRTRTANELSVLATSVWSASIGPITGPYATLDIGNPKGRYLEVETRLVAGDAAIPPTLLELTAQHEGSP
jgi:streptogramin lyase